MYCVTTLHVCKTKGGVLRKDHISDVVNQTTVGLLAIFMAGCNELFKCIETCIDTNEYVYLL